MDSWKGCLTAEEACSFVARAFSQRRPGWVVKTVPMADGGEGTAQALMAARGGRWVEMQATGPRSNQPVEAGFAWFEQDRAAAIEMASASGLTHLKPEQYAPLLTTTRGTGELLAEAMRRGARRIWLTLGGSATVDGGVGAATALGWRFLDAAGRPLPPGGGALKHLARIEPPACRALPVIEALCDVDSPLTGPEGAAAVFGPQKGAGPAEVLALDCALARLAQVLREQMGVEVETLPGAGAAGGFGAGAVAFLGARLVPGVEAVMAANGFEDAVQGADWIVTGEGRFDLQSLRGKVVSGVLRIAAAAGARVGVLAGSVGLSEEACRAAGVAWARAATPPDMPMEEAKIKAARLLDAAAAQEIHAMEHDAVKGTQ